MDDVPFQFLVPRQFNDLLGFLTDVLQRGQNYAWITCLAKSVPWAKCFEISSFNYFRLFLESSDVWHRWDSC